MIKDYTAPHRTDVITDEQLGCLFLWEEVIRRAVEDAIQSKYFVTEINSRTAMAFIFKKGADTFNSFENLCHLLNVDPGKIRKYVLEKRQAKQNLRYKNFS